MYAPPQDVTASWCIGRVSTNGFNIDVAREMLLDLCVTFCACGGISLEYNLETPF
jgi:Na+/serine symporter